MKLEKELLHNNSSKINILFESIYTIFKPLNKKTIEGFKLVLDKHDNFYSVTTGTFRYKLGRIRSNYHSLYKNTNSFNEEMVDKTAIFKNLEDIKLFFPELCKDKRCCIVKIKLSGDLKLVNGTNKYTKNIEMYIGNTIESIIKI